MGYIRAYLMGDAYVAVGDEVSTLFYNPAGLAGLPETTTELINPQINVNKLVKDATLHPDDLSARYTGSSQADFRKIMGETVFINFNMSLPAIYMPESGIAYGLMSEMLGSAEILGNPVLPSLRFEFFVDQIIFIGFFGKASDNLSLGITPKMITRYGVSKVYTIGELFAAGETLSIDNDPAFRDAANGVTFSTMGVDTGLIYRFNFWRGWEPRLGISLLNIGGSDPDEILAGMEFGPRKTKFEPPQAGELPQINTIGFAVSPEHLGIRYTIAFDYVDFTKTVLPGNDFKKRTRLGFEMGVGVREDGTALFSLLAGWNSGYPSYGILSRVWIMEVGFGSYSVELGEKAGDKGDQRAILIIGFRF